MDASTAPAPWKPRRGAPAAFPGETKADYTKRIRRERNRRYAAKQEAKTPRARVKAQAERRKPVERQPERRQEPERRPGSADGRVLGVVVGAFDAQGRPADVVAFDPERASYLASESYEQFLDRKEAERKLPPPPPRSVLVTGMGQRSFDPSDLDEIADCIRWLDGQPEVEGIEENTIREALSRVQPGRPFNLRADAA